MATYMDRSKVRLAKDTIISNAAITR
jgi:hypothetical protein